MTDSHVYDTAAALAARFGPDAAIEIQAQGLDAVLFPGCGDVLRYGWRALLRIMLIERPRWLAEQSAAEHELAYYGGDQ